MTWPDLPSMAPMEPLAENLVFRNDYVSLFDDPVRHSDGRRGTYVRLAPAGDGRGIAALVTKDDLVALVLTWRYATGSWEWGIPRGFSQASNSTETALTELKEELGGTPNTLTLLSSINPDSGLLSSTVDIFHATWTQPDSVPHDINEVHAVAWVPVSELWRAISNGIVRDGFTLAAITLGVAEGVISVEPKAS